MPELKRKFYDQLLKWKQSKHQECLLVKGARQIGKTFIIEKFGREQYDSFIEFNFVLDSEACSIFDGSLKAEDLYRKNQGLSTPEALLRLPCYLYPYLQEAMYRPRRNPQAEHRLSTVRMCLRRSCFHRSCRSLHN